MQIVPSNPPIKTTLPTIENYDYTKYTEYFTECQKNTFSALTSGRQKNFFLTGSAGTGKSFVLRKYIRWLCDVMKVKREHLAIVTPTGIAAVNVGGETINSRFKINPYFNYADIPLEKAASYSQERRQTRMIIIDEISMVSKRLFTHLHMVCGGFSNRNQPFGGLPIMVIGDFLQLPPVIKSKKNIDVPNTFLYKSIFLCCYARNAILYNICVL